MMTMIGRGECVRERIFIAILLLGIMTATFISSVYWGCVCIVLAAYSWYVVVHRLVDEIHTKELHPSCDYPSSTPIVNEKVPLIAEENYGLQMLHVQDECNEENMNGIAMNSITPVPFENDLFKGKVYFLIKTNPPNNTWQHLFDGRRRMFWIQVQGILKQQPQGSIYLGGELPTSVSIGMLARGLAQLIMGIMQRLVGIIHFSFGDDDELPHCVFPLYQAVDELIITPEGKEPPSLGQCSFGESKEQLEKRRKTPIGEEKYVVGATYTFHFHTMYVDLTRWKIINLPGMKDIKLTTFFDTLPLRLTCYDVVATPKHECVSKKYLFCFTIRFFSEAERRASLSTSSQNLDMSFITKDPIFVPYWIEMLNGSRRRVYFLVVDNTSKDSVIVSLEAKALAKELGISLHATSKLARYDAIEEQRQMIEKISGDKVRSIGMHLKWTPMPATSLGIRLGKTQSHRILLQQEVFRAITDTQLRQEYLVLTADALFFYRTQSKCPCKVIYLGSILQVQAMNLPYLSNDSFLSNGIEINTPAEVVYLCVPTTHAKLEWLRHLQTHQAGSSVPNSPSLLTSQPLAPLRIIMNSRRLFPNVEGDLSCLDVSIEAIRATRLLAQGGSQDATGVFLDSVSAFRCVDLETLVSHEEKMSFFLNVYICMKWHAKSCLPHGSIPRATYRVGKQNLKLSLVDIEHGILRARFHRMDSSVSTPSSFAREYALVNSDFRIAFALHAPYTTLPMFEPNRVHEQLNILCGTYFEKTVGVDVHRNVIHLPMICLKYRYDYGPSGDVVDCSRKIMGYLDETLSEKLQKVLDVDGREVKVQHYDVQGVYIDGLSL